MFDDDDRNMHRNNICSKILIFTNVLVNSDPYLFFFFSDAVKGKMLLTLQYTL